MKRIVYATDGSEASLAGAHLLARLPLPVDCQLKLVTVLPELGEVNPRAALEPALEILCRGAALVETKVCRGFADEEILRVAAPHASTPATDLIVVGSRGRTGLARFLVGSTAERIARHAVCPVLVARPLVNDLRTVVLAIDGSEGAARAAAFLHRFPLPEETEVRIVTVLPHLEARSPTGKALGITELKVAYPQYDEARQHLDALVTAFTLHGRKCSADLRCGNPAAGLLQCAEEHQADLLVVGSRGRGAVTRFLLGGVSEKVVRHAPCSVLVVR